MAYLNRRIIQRRERYTAPRYGVPLGNLFDDARAMMNAAQNAPNPACDAAGRAAQATYDTQLYQITSTWKQTDGFYYVQDMLDIITSGLAFQQAGQKVLDQVASAYGEFPNDALKSAIDSAQNDLFDVGKNALDFLSAVHAAQDSGASVVDAQGLRDWVIDAISAAGQAAYVAAYTQCAMPSGAAFIIAAASVFTLAGKDFLAAIGKSLKVVLAAGEVVYKTTVGALDLAATVIKYAPYVAAAYGLSWLWKNYGKGR